ncbi:MAG TPA: hypothetical protein VMM56_09220 [Planctomycetaceae bacterium]|nr:hypothetical protein [Planctomycetaceae bacterium]
MSESKRSISARVGAVATLATVALLFVLTQRPSVPAAEAAVLYRLEAEAGQKWFKGNLHTHSLWSDGDDYPEMIADWYRRHEYQFLCYTDHNITQDTEKWIDVEKSKGKREAYDKLLKRFPVGWVVEREQAGRLEVKLKRFEELYNEFTVPGEFLLIRGEEISDRFGKFPVHMNASNIQEMIPPLGGESVYDVMQNNVNAVIAQRERTGEPIMIHLNHPNFGYAVTAEELMRVRGENFFEVYNGHPGVNNSGNEQRASAERIWDIILAKRITELELPIMYGLATDDGHNYHNMPSRASEPGRGWVMVLAEKLTPDALIAALEAGQFYSTSGVRLKTVKATAEAYELEVEAEQGVEYEIQFIGTKKGFDPESKPVLDDKGNEIRTTRRYSDDVGAVLATVKGTSARYEFSENDLYVRAKVISTKKHPNPSEVGEFERAWAQPVLGPAGR